MLVVKVPVLSEQITEVHPRVSTEGKDLESHNSLSIERLKVYNAANDLPNNSVLLGHPPGAKSQASGDDSGETFRDSSDGQGNGDLEVVDGTLNPGTTMSGIVEVTNVNSPDSNANQSNDL